jgi:hypothetical protein
MRYRLVVNEGTVRVDIKCDVFIDGPLGGGFQACSTTNNMTAKAAEMAKAIEVDARSAPKPAPVAAPAPAAPPPAPVPVEPAAAAATP